MSGIILPGQGSESDGGSGIELPKGFSRAKEEKAQEKRAAAESPALDPTLTGGQPGGEPDFLFPPQAAQVQCPNCGTPYPVAIFSIVDFGENPELRGALLSNQINMAICPACGSGGPLNAPLMIHDPEHEFLGVFLPADNQSNEAQRQKIIGDLTQRLMQKLPSEARRGYMLQPKQYMDWQRFMEVFWGYEGVTPEMLRRQRDQTALIQRLLGLANDPQALGIAVERDKALIDREFMSLFDRIFVMSRGQMDEEGAQAFQAVRTRLLDSTEAGAQVKAREARLRSLLAEIDETSTRTDVLDLLLAVMANPEDEDLLPSLAVSVLPVLDYEFLLELSQRLDATDDEAERARLETLRELIAQMQETQRESQASGAQQAQALLQEILEQPDAVAAVAEYADYIDETFLALLGSQIQSAEEKGATAAVRRFTQIYEAAVGVLEANMPDDIRLLNNLLSARDEGEMRALINENREMITPELVETLGAFEQQARAGGQIEIANRVRSLLSRLKLMG
ncbi:MAG: hypothetical protein H6642_02280 [Caldilineaceae bacterium]|nr:hypothetical protein [Caldilineaceae bacterium]